MANRTPIATVEIPKLSAPQAAMLASNDIYNGLRLWRIWTALSWQEFRSTYSRSIFGVLWVVLSFAAFVFLKLTIFSKLLDTGTAGYYDSFLLLGFFIWFYVSQSVSGAPDSFVSSSGWIRSEPLPLSVYLFKAVLREAYGLFLTSIVVIVGLWYVGYKVTVSGILLSLLAIPFYFLTAFAVKLFLGLISARFRDISHLVKAIMLPMMFLTPIFWMPTQMPGLMKYLWWNPFYHFIELFRSPILDNVFPIESWIFSICFCCVIFLAGTGLFSTFRHRIVFWL